MLFLKDMMTFTLLFFTWIAITHEVAAFNLTWMSATRPNHPQFSNFHVGNNVTFCHSSDCLKESTSYPSTIFFVAFLEGKLSDLIVHMHLPWIGYMFSKSRYAIRFVLMDCDYFYLSRGHETHENCMECFEDCRNLVQSTIQFAPDSSVFISMYPHCVWGDVDALFPNLHKSREFSLSRHLYGYHRPILIHGNHEQPWSTNPTDKQNYIGPVNALNDIYSNFDLVFRNYYSRPHSTTSSYLPVGPSVYGWLRMNMFSQGGVHKYKVASQRGLFCYFSGRFQYPHSASGFVAEAERKKMLQVSTQLIPPSSEISISGTTDKISEEYLCTVHERNLTTANHLNMLLDSVFALCPRGNNLETFRFYEALESGAIPIFVKGSSVDYDFIEGKFMHV